MANATIRLVFNLKTGKKDIHIDFLSDADALPIEHEQDHRQLIENLLGQGILAGHEVGDVHVNRVSGKIADTEQSQQTEETRAPIRH